MNWEKIKAKYPVGIIIEGVVVHHAPFGVFVNINEPEVLGLVQITDFLDSGRMHMSQYPKIGSKLKAIVLGHSPEDRKQIWLSIKPSLLENK